MASKRLAAAILAALTASSAWGQYETHRKVPLFTFSQLGLLSNNRVSDVRSDQTNQVWVTTQQGVSAVAPATGIDPADPRTYLTRARFFPLRQ
ncbi:MAG: hypothetical protein IH608_01900, partial [Proteobacteria bacterium]|nr:hypothetical protein [Pseudomonadota bacterium]